MWIGLRRKPPPQIAHESNSLNRHNDYRDHKGGNVIARVWRGWTTLEDADGYEGHLKPELLPGLRKVAGFRGSYLLRRVAERKWSL